MAENMVITIGRQFGSGGREVAKCVAEKLGIPFYDKELIALAAKESGLSEALFEGIDEKPTNSLLYSLAMGVQSGHGGYYGYGDVLNSDKLLRIQSQVIHDIVDKGPCVVVGRCADYVLRNNPNCVSVFVHADLSQRIKRIMEKNNLSEKEAKSLITKTDKRRSSFYNFYTNNQWGAVDNYNLALDTSKISVDDAARLICDFAKTSCGK